MKTLSACIKVALIWMILLFAADFAMESYWQDVAGCSCKDCIRVYLAGGPDKYFAANPE